MSYSKYAERMAKLSGKMFGEYKTPPMPRELFKQNHNPGLPRYEFNRLHYMNKKVIHNQARLPHDIDPFYVKYYPPHPQIRKLMHVLREHGLYRDEHVDFKEEMKRISALRGKTGRVKGGFSGKREQIKKLD